MEESESSSFCFCKGLRYFSFFLGGKWEMEHTFLCVKLLICFFGARAGEGLLQEYVDEP